VLILLALVGCSKPEVVSGLAAPQVVSEQKGSDPDERRDHRSSGRVSGRCCAGGRAMIPFP